MYKEIIVETTTEGSDFVADAFFSIGAGGVKIDDPNDIKDVITQKDGHYWDYLDEKLLENVGGSVKVSAFVSTSELDNKLLELKKLINTINFVDMGSLKTTVADYKDCDWLVEWKKYYKPIEVKPFVIVPSWIDYKEKEGDIIIKIEPTMAFGTGEHESTRLCLGLMSTIDFAGKNVFDVGAGSGILGIAAHKKGAKLVYMRDIDSTATASAKENAILNNINSGIIAETGSFLPEKMAFPAQIVLANLTADLLIQLSKNLREHMEDEGILICSGIISTRKDEVINVYKEKGFSLVTQEKMGDWEALILKKEK